MTTAPLKALTKMFFEMAPKNESEINSRADVAGHDIHWMETLSYQRHRNLRTLIFDVTDAVRGSRCSSP